MAHFDVGTFMQKRKEMRQSIVMGNRNLELAQTEINQLEVEVDRKRKVFLALKEKNRRLDAKIKKVEDEVDGLPNVKQSRQCTQPSFISDKSVDARKRFPTSFENGKVKSSASVARKRRKETFDIAQKIHGGSAESEVPGAIGIVDTAMTKCNEKVLVDVMSASRKFNKSVMPTIYKRKLSEFEPSQENMVRSISVYYSGGVTGKKKYRKLYRDSCYKNNVSSKKSVRLSINNCPIPRLVPYNKLMPFIKNIPLGSIYSVYETLCYDLCEEDKVCGCYRNLRELLVKLGEFYLSGSSGHILKWFGEEYKFFVSLGGDGAPFGKDDTACAWLVSFLNIGRGILSSNENYLLFGSNCSENSIPVQRFVKILVSDITNIEQETFPCTYTTGNGDTVTISVKFQITEFPNDMKMVAFLCGELSNSAKYFSSYANVSSENATNVIGQFGKEKSKTWQPWTYSDRIKVAKSVEALKQTLKTKNLANSTKRSKITTFIASKKSRQEFEPPLGPLVDRIHVDPLHLKNNACALAHRLLLNEVLLVSQLPHSIKTFSQVSNSSPFAKYVSTMKHKCHLVRLANKIIRWFNEIRGDGKSFDYRFTGKDSRLFLQNYMFLIATVDPFLKDGSKTQFTFHVLAYLCLTLRDCVSVFNRIEISDTQLADLENNCQTYFALHYLFFNHHPTAWTLGKIVPTHTRDIKDKYGMGLGLNSMEGREAKHISIARYSKNTNYKARWEQIFQHEYVSLVWLRERGYNTEKPASSCSLRYIPKRATEDPNFCYCGLEKESQSGGCSFCLHELRKVIIDKVKKGCTKG